MAVARFRQHPLQQPMFDAWEKLVGMVSGERSMLPKFGAPDRTEGGLGPTVAELQQAHPEGALTSPPEMSRRFGDVGFGSANVENIMSLLGEMIRPVDAASGLTESLTDVGLNPLSMGAGALAKLGKGKVKKVTEQAGLLAKQRSSEGLMAAVKSKKSGEVYPGYDHPDAFERAKKAGETFGDQFDYDTGFLDERGKYLTRQEADESFGVYRTHDLPAGRSGFREHLRKKKDVVEKVAEEALAPINRQTEQGRLLKGYHGTRSNFDRFKEGENYFTNDPGLASKYAKGGGGNVRPVNLNFENPLTIDADGRSVRAVLGAHEIGKARDAGYDGIIVKNVVDVPGYTATIGGKSVDKTADVYVSFRPDQIQSAIGKRESAGSLSALQKLGKGKVAPPTPITPRLGQGPKRAGEVVDGLRVTDNVPNLSSISASGTEEIGGGIREIPLSQFDSDPKDLFYAADDLRKTEALAEKIRTSGDIDPLIVAYDDKGPYILEGAHRLGALHLLNKKSFPALVVEEFAGAMEAFVRKQGISK